MQKEARIKGDKKATTTKQKENREDVPREGTCASCLLLNNKLSRFYRFQIIDTMKFPQKTNNGTAI